MKKKVVMLLTAVATCATLMMACGNKETAAPVEEPAVETEADVEDNAEAENVENTENAENVADVEAAEDAANTEAAAEGENAEADAEVTPEDAENGENAVEGEAEANANADAETEETVETTEEAAE